MKSNISEDGTIGKLEKTDIQELENTLITKELLKENTLKLKTIESLKKIYGDKLELIL